MKILYRNHNNNYSSPATDFFKIENHIFKTTTHLGLVFALIEISSWYYQQPQKTNPKKELIPVVDVSRFGILEIDVKHTKNPQHKSVMNLHIWPKLFIVFSDLLWYIFFFCVQSCHRQFWSMSLFQHTRLNWFLLENNKMHFNVLWNTIFLIHLV